jgi:hypothetical protein
MNAYTFVYTAHQAECPLTVKGNKALGTEHTNYKTNFEKAWKFVILVLVIIHLCK